MRGTYAESVKLAASTYDDRETAEQGKGHERSVGFEGTYVGQSFKEDRPS